MRPHPVLSPAGRAVLALGLPDPEPVDEAAVRQVALERDAASWRLLATSPHVADLVAEWLDWDRRRVDREASHAVSDATDWQVAAWAPTYAELARRRAEPGCPVRCPGCERVRTTWPPPTGDAMLCDRCRAAA